MNFNNVIGVVFGLTALFSIASVFVNLPGFLGDWFGKKHEYKIFFLANIRLVRGLIEILLLPVPEKYHPAGARIVAALFMGIASYGALFYYNV